MIFSVNGKVGIFNFKFKKFSSSLSDESVKVVDGSIEPENQSPKLWLVSHC